MHREQEIKDPPVATRKPRMVSVSLLILVVVTFVSGMLAAFLIASILAKQQTTLSSSALIGFVFTVAIGAASLILALVSINLSQHAEETLTRRSDEGIRLQNSVFVKTSEVLSRIQASTGVTEKRIEDIIAGRTSSIAREAVERSLPESQTKVSKEVVNRIKTELAESLRTELMPLIGATPSSAQQYLVDLDSKQLRRKEATDHCVEFVKSIVSGLSRFPDVTVIFQGYGNTEADTSEEFWDALAGISNKRVAIDAFVKMQFDAGSLTLHDNPLERRNFAKQVIWRMEEDNLDIVVLGFEEELRVEPGLNEFASLFERFNQRTKDQRIVCLFGRAESLAEQIYSITKTAFT